MGTQHDSELKDFKRRFSAIFDQSPLSIQILAQDGRTLLVNRAYRQLWGISDEFTEEFILKEYNILTDELIPEDKKLLIRRAYAGETVQIPEFFYDPAALNLPGRARWAGGLIYPLKDDRGEVKEVVLIHQDLSDRKRHEAIMNFLAEVKTILLSTLDYDKILNEVASASIPFLADGCMVDLLEGEEVKRIIIKHRSPQTEELLKELQEKFPPKLGSPHPSVKVIQQGVIEFTPVVSNEHINAHVVNQDHGDLIRRIGLNSFIAVPLTIRGNTIGVINLLITTYRLPFDQQDLTTAMELGRHAAVAIDNARLYRDAQRAVLIRDDFISIASHELRTPITSLSLQLDILANIIQNLETSEAENVKKVLASTKRQVQRITRRVEDMLDVSRIDTGKLKLDMQEVDLTLLTYESLERFEYHLTSLGVQLNINASGPLLVQCDPYRIEQVIINLMSNALRYGKRLPIEVTLEQGDDCAIFKIQDQGIGIAKDAIHQIFERFHRIDSSHELSGLGLGLFISHQIIQEHQGSIEVQSEQGKGSIFSFTLPSSR